jgi:hypothetical protein
MYDPSDPEVPASAMVRTSSGRYDIHNITGVRKAQLIMEGEVDSDVFISPPNVTGAKLKELRDAHNATMDKAIQNISDVKNEYKKGDLVKYHNIVVEVLDVHDTRGVKITKREGGKVWVHQSKVEKVEVSPEGE